MRTTEIKDAKNQIFVQGDKLTYIPNGEVVTAVCCYENETCIQFQDKGFMLVSNKDLLKK